MKRKLRGKPHLQQPIQRAVKAHLLVAIEDFYEEQQSIPSQVEKHSAVNTHAVNTQKQISDLALLISKPLF